MSSTSTFIDAARKSIGKAMAADDRIAVLGEDITAGGPFGLTKGLVDSYGARRIINTPISESSIMGVAIGMALGGRRPLVDLMFTDFVTLASDQLFNHAAKIHYMSGGRRSVPMTVWTTGGAGTRWGAQHSQRLDGLFAAVPGLKVLAPATSAAADAALASAFDDPDPVVVIADRALLYRRDELPGDGGDPTQPRVVQAGTELTLVATGRLVFEAIDASRSSGVAAEIIDLQRIAPLRVNEIVDSVRRTRRLLVLHDEARTAGVASTVAAAVVEQAFGHLDAAPMILTSPATPIPAAATLEDHYLIDGTRIATALRELVAR
jgi:acetoin:2,6-dichlorophenolindophenol oxidoreductase subunit beta